MKLKQNIIRPARRLRARCISEFCKKSVVRNCNKFSDERRLEIHQSFWGNMNWDQRKIYVVGLVTRKGTARKTKDESRREGTYNYFLPLNETNKVQVCRTTFLNTLNLGSYTVQSWIKKANASGVIPCQDVQNLSRVKTSQPEARTKLLTAHSFLDSIPKLPSHYCRKESESYTSNLLTVL